MRMMAGIRSTRIGTTLLLSLALSLLTGCAAMGAGNANTQPSSGVAITPATGSVRAGDTLQFTAKVSGTMNQAVVWSVNGIVGGNATDGMISATGMYTAPATLPNPNSISIAATSSSDKSLSGKTTITLENPVPMEDLHATNLVWPIDQDLAIEATSAQQRRVENFGAVRRRQQDHPAARIKAVQFA